MQASAHPELRGPIKHMQQTLRTRIQSAQMLVFVIAHQELVNALQDLQAVLANEVSLL